MYLLGEQVSFKVVYFLRDLLVSKTRKYVLDENFKIGEEIQF